MNIRPKDTYQVIENQSISQDMLNTLMILYQPFVGSNGILVYLTLLSCSHISSYAQNIDTLLITLGNMTPDHFERSIVSLEECMLLKTYGKQDKQVNHFIYALNAPLSKNEFFKSPYFNQLYFKTVGQSVYQENKSLFQMKELRLDAFEDISHPVRIQQELQETETFVQQIQPVYAYQNDETINFDYQKFLSITSNLVFPTVLRTNENMYLIGKLATLYGLTPENMRSVLDRCVNPIKNTLDEEKLKQMCARIAKYHPNDEDPYSLPPLSFLQSKMNGAKVSVNEKRLLEYLSFDMHFSNEVINILIEYCLKECQNQLPTKFVQAVASTWARDHVTSRQDAIAHTKMKRNNHISKQTIKIDMPAYYKEGLSEEDLDTNPASDASRAKFQEALAKLRGN